MKKILMKKKPEKKTYLLKPLYLKLDENATDAAKNLGIAID